MGRNGFVRHKEWLEYGMGRNGFVYDTRRGECEWLTRCCVLPVALRSWCCCAVQGADPWIGDRLLARSPLHHAARANEPDCIDAILTSPFVELTGKVRNKECR
jgi:hypothetical protein